MKDVDFSRAATVIEKIRKAYDEKELEDLLRSGLLIEGNPLSKALIDGIAEAVYMRGVEIESMAGERKTLDVRDRERCLITLLAAREAKLELAIHIYFAAMAGVRLEEVIHILLLAGAYSGIPSFAGGLEVVEKTIAVLDQLASQSGGEGSVEKEGAASAPTPTRVLGALARAFQSSSGPGSETVIRAVEVILKG